MDYKAKFIEFLKERGAYGEFEGELLAYLRDSVEGYLDTTAIENYLYKAFPWGGTKAGFKHWSILCGEWAVIVAKAGDEH